MVAGHEPLRDAQLAPERAVAFRQTRDGHGGVRARRATRVDGAQRRRERRRGVLRARFADSRIARESVGNRAGVRLLRRLVPSVRDSSRDLFPFARLFQVRVLDAAFVRALYVSAHRAAALHRAAPFAPELGRRRPRVRFQSARVARRLRVAPRRPQVPARAVRRGAPQVRRGLDALFSE